MRSGCRIVDAATGQVVLERVEIADTFWRRLWGLLGKSGLSRNEGLLLRPCNGVHTCGMKFAIDVALLDRENVVLRVCPNVLPWRIVPGVRNASQTLEAASGALEGLEGRKLTLE